jgi:hypothetical protein
MLMHLEGTMTLSMPTHIIVTNKNVQSRVFDTAMLSFVTLIVVLPFYRDYFVWKIPSSLGSMLEN